MREEQIALAFDSRPYGIPVREGAPSRVGAVARIPDTGATVRRLQFMTLHTICFREFLHPIANL